MDSSQTISLPLTLMSIVFISSGSTEVTYHVTKESSLTCIKSSVGCNAFQNQTNITAQPEQNVILPCRAPDSQPVVAVEWNRADLGSEYVLLYRNRKINLENQHLSFKNRVDLQDRQVKNGDVSLILRNVTTDDRGTYRCQVVQTVINSKRKTVVIINLDVRPPPGEPDGGTNDVPVALVVGLVLSISVIIIAAVVGNLIFKKRSRIRRSRGPLEPQECSMIQNGTVET